MDGDNATRFVASLVKSIQALCNGYIDFSTSIEVIGHIHLNIDRSVKLDYVLTEEVSKSVSEGATVFASHSYHSHPPSSVSSKNSNDSSKSSRQKQSVCVTQGSEADPLGFSSSVPLASSKSDSHSHARSSSHFVESSDSSHADNFVDSHDTESVKQEKSRTSFQVQESQERRRRSAPSHSQSQSHRTTSPAAKRIRHTDSNPEDFEVVEIKEEPDDEPAVFFGDSSSHMAAGQDLQTPDFSSVVMESLDRVGQVEGTKLVASGDGAQMQQPPFPVMMHSNTGMPSSSVSSAMPGPSLSDPQAQSLASTSGVRQWQLKPPNINSNSNKSWASETWDQVIHENFEQKKRDRAEAIQAAVDFVHQSGLPAYRVCNMFNVSKTTLYRHLASMAQQAQSSENSSLGARERDLASSVSMESSSFGTGSVSNPGMGIVPGSVAASSAAVSGSGTCNVLGSSSAAVSGSSAGSVFGSRSGAVSGSVTGGVLDSNGQGEGKG